MFKSRQAVTEPLTFSVVKMCGGLQVWWNGGYWIQTTLKVGNPLSFCWEGIYVRLGLIELAVVVGIDRVEEQFCWSMTKRRISSTGGIVLMLKARVKYIKGCQYTKLGRLVLGLRACRCSSWKREMGYIPRLVCQVTWTCMLRKAAHLTAKLGYVYIQLCIHIA